MVSGTLSLPSRGTFHHSLTVLIPLSVIRKYLALPGGPGRFTRDFTGPVLLGYHHTQPAAVSSTGLSPTTVTLPNAFDYNHNSHALPMLRKNE